LKGRHPEFIGQSREFIIVIEDKAALDRQAAYSSDDKTALLVDVKAIGDYAENGALHYAQHIINKTSLIRSSPLVCSAMKRIKIRPMYVDQRGYKLPEVENFEDFWNIILRDTTKTRFFGETPQETWVGVILKKNLLNFMKPALRILDNLVTMKRNLVVSIYYLPKR